MRRMKLVKGCATGSGFSKVKTGGIVWRKKKRFQQVILFLY